MDPDISQDMLNRLVKAKDFDPFFGEVLSVLEESTMADVI